MNDASRGMDDLVRRQPTWYDAVPPDPDHAKAVLERLLDEEVVAVLTQTATAITGNLDGLHRTAHTLAYDAARKAVDAVLVGSGYRGTREGGHVATVEAIRHGQSSRSVNAAR